jgi:YHS domain-containing protein
MLTQSGARVSPGERNDLVLLRADNNRHKSVTQVTDGGTPIAGKTYCFGNEAAKAEFMKDPEGNLAKAQSYYSTKNPG